MSEEKKGTLNILIGFKTSNGEAGSFSPWNPYALKSMGVTAGALDPKTWSYHVRGDLYEDPPIARKGHETGGSVNVQGIDGSCGNTVRLSHVFFIDTTGHRDKRKPDHWNYQIYTKKGDGEWTPLDKRLLKFHEIPISEWIEIWAQDSNGKTESKKVFRNSQK
jgi:hypothetical protein